MTPKIGATSVDRTGASSVAPASDTSGDSRSQYYTYLTRPADSSPVLYNGDRLWATVTLTLETAGPVTVGQQAGLDAGQGIDLDTDIPVKFTIAKGTRLYVNASTVNRIKVAVEPLPWLEQVTGTLRQLVGFAQAMFQRIAK